MYTRGVYGWRPVGNVSPSHLGVPSDAWLEEVCELRVAVGDMEGTIANGDEHLP